jgi:outer membrane receptor protein involved in Fe transport
VGGARLEDAEILVNTLSPFETLSDYTARVKNTDWLPSFNLTYELSPITNIRLAYSHSVNRPELRELARFYFYDYSIYQGAYGNPLLKRALVRNYDIRFEMFPGVGEVFAASYFYKNITDAIEERILVSSNPERTWFNSPNGRNYGFEFEARGTLDFLGAYFANMSIVGNYTRIFSDIEYEQGSKISAGNGVYYDVFETKQREMQGQSPYLINVSLLFREPTLGTSISLLFNEFGRRLDAVGDARPDDIFEETHNTIDIAVMQPIGSSWEVKFAAQDIAAKPRRFVTRLGDPHREITPGSTYSLKVSLSL